MVFETEDSVKGVLLSPPPHRRGNQGTEHLSDVPKVTEPGGPGPRFGAQEVFESPYYAEPKICAIIILYLHYVGLPSPQSSLG